MPSNAQDVYLESRVLSADPLELVQLLYQGALDAVENARQRLRQGDIAARSRQIAKAGAILTELACSLDPAAGGEFSRTLLELYDYMQRRLLEANIAQSEPILAEVSRLLATLLEGWLNCRSTAYDRADATAQPAEAATEGNLVAVSC
jgi:flagellar protein FliS